MKNSKNLYILIGLLLLLGLSLNVYAREPEHNQVIIYEHTNYEGSYIVLSYDKTVNSVGSWHTDSGKSWNDKISSVKVGKHAKLILYADNLTHNNGGASIVFQGNCSSIKKISKLSSYGWNDRATGLKVRMADCYR